jgi:hypothetical protein
LPLKGYAGISSTMKSSGVVRIVARGKRESAVDMAVMEHETDRA